MPLTNGWIHVGSSTNDALPNDTSTTSTSRTTDLFVITFPIVHILEFVQSWQSPTLYCTEDRHSESLTIVGYNPNERRDRNYQRRWRGHYH